MARRWTAGGCVFLALAFVGWIPAALEPHGGASLAAHGDVLSPERVPPIPPGDSSEIALVLDPTIFTHQSAAELDAWLADLRRFYVALPSRTCVNVFFVQRGRIGAGPDMRPCFVFDHSARGAQRHRTRLTQSYEDIAARYRALWTSMHTPAQRARSQSCLLTTIARAGALVPASRTGPRFYMVILSDMLEECDEWLPLNLEAAAQREDIQPINAGGLTDLSRTDGVYVRIAHHNRVQTHTARTQLVNFWGSVFRQVRTPHHAMVPLLDGGLLRR